MHLLDFYIKIFDEWRKMEKTKNIYINRTMKSVVRRILKSFLKITPFPKFDLLL